MKSFGKMPQISGLHLYSNFVPSVKSEQTFYGPLSRKILDAKPQIELVKILYQHILIYPQI